MVSDTFDCINFLFSSFGSRVNILLFLDLPTPNIMSTFYFCFIDIAMKNLNE